MRGIGIILAAALVAAVAWAQEEGDRIDELIQQLAADDFDAREKATEELKKIGKPALEKLRAAAESKDAEVRTRARAVVEHIERPAKTGKKEERRSTPRGFEFGLRGAGTTVMSDGTGTTYKIRPQDGDAIEFRKNNDGTVKLTYTANGQEKTAEAESLEEFLETHKDLAETYGITKDGIEHGGARVGFGRGPGLRIVPGGRWWVDPPGDRDDLEELLERLREQNEEFEELFGGRRAGGAAFERADDTLRAHLDIPEDQGLVVKRVPRGSAAEKLGLKEHDIVLEIDGKAAKSPRDARGLSEKSRVTLLRKGKKVTPTPSEKKDY